MVLTNASCQKYVDVITRRCLWCLHSCGGYINMYPPHNQGLQMVMTKFVYFVCQTTIVRKVET